MNPVLEDLLRLLHLERIEDNFYRGESRDIGSAQVFGGQVVGQALSAAQHTVEGRRAHSLHAYFLRRGDMGSPIIYEVDRSRDGGSFSVRRVVAIQHGRPIFNLAVSFQEPEEGLEHQAEMPDVPGPDGLQDVTEVPPETLTRVPEKMRRYLTDQRPFDEFFATGKVAARETCVDQGRRQIAGRTKPAPKLAGLCVRLRIARYQHSPTRFAFRPGAGPDGQPRSRIVVSSRPAG